MCYQLVYWKCALFIYLRYIYLCSLILVQLCCRLFDASSLIWMLASRFFWAFFAADWMPWMQVIIVYHLHKFVLLMLVGWCSGSDQQLELGAFFLNVNVKGSIFWMWMWKGPFSDYVWSNCTMHQPFVLLRINSYFDWDWMWTGISDYAHSNLNDPFRSNLKDQLGISDASMRTVANYDSSSVCLYLVLEKLT